MIKAHFILTSKKLLTPDVYELSYRYEDPMDINFIHGQYVLFQLAPGLNRAYSVAGFNATGFTLIIKRIPDGRGSPIICDAVLGTVFSGMLPLGHFVLQSTHTNKCFIGTGTGFAPLYCQLSGCEQLGLTDIRVAFVYGVRTLEDVFYSDEIYSLGARFTDFSYVPYFSREGSLSGVQMGYVTDWITSEHIAPFGEFYLCGSPQMVQSARSQLISLGIGDEQIFWEQF